MTVWNGQFWQFGKGNFDSLEKEIFDSLSWKILTIWNGKFWPLWKGNFDSLEKEILTVWKRKFWQLGTGNFNSLEKENFDSLGTTELDHCIKYSPDHPLFEIIQDKLCQLIPRCVLKTYKKEIILNFSYAKVKYRGVLEQMINQKDGM